MNQITSMVGFLGWLGVVIIVSTPIMILLGLAMTVSRLRHGEWPDWIERLQSWATNGGYYS